MEDARISVEVEINPTESKDRVIKAVENIFGDIPIQTRHLHESILLISKVKGLATLTKFSNLLRRERIQNAARKALFEGLKGTIISFFLNKQVAYAGHISFSEEATESPLGPIKVHIECENPRNVINWLVQRKP